jgi:hypothetical protein
MPTVYKSKYEKFYICLLYINMSNLEKLKQQLMLKPVPKEREPVAVVIKRKKSNTKTTVRDTTVVNDNDDGSEAQETTKDDESKEPEGDDQDQEDEQVQDIGDKTSIQAPMIVDVSHKPFDRKSILERLMTNNKSSVSIKPSIRSKLLSKDGVEADADVDVQVDADAVDDMTPVESPTKKPRKLGKRKLLTIEEESEEGDDAEVDEEEKKDEDVIDAEAEVEEQIVIRPVKKPRITKKIEKGVAIIGPEMKSVIGDTSVVQRIPKKSPPINIKVSSYYMNNREKFVNFINSIFEPYREEIMSNKQEITCDNIGKSSKGFDLLTHQKIVRDYINLYTPYRGVLLFHGLGSGKTLSSIAIAEGMKDVKKIIVMTPASLRANYVEELKKAGDVYYKKNQFWEWIQSNNDVEMIKTLSAILNLPQEYIKKQKGAWLINVSKPSNYDSLKDEEKISLDKQINEMISTKYTFINYNGLRAKKLNDLTSGYTKNLFDNSVVIIDEAHNLISRIVNKLKKEKDIPEDDRGEKEHLPTNLATKLYEYLMSANNAKIVLLSGTPVINYPNEFAILFNILRGYIKTWKIPLNIKTTNKINKEVLQKMLLGEKSHDYLDYSPTSKILTITRNPFGFKNRIKKTGEYQGVSTHKKDEKGNNTFETDFISDDEFETKIISILKRNDIQVVSNGIKIYNMKALPDKIEHFYSRFIEDSTGDLKNVDALKRRIIGLSSYFRSAQENLLPKYNKELGVDYHVVRVPMSNYQFKIYEAARIKERKSEKPKKNKPGSDLEDHNSTYKIFSRLFCNYVMPNRPLPNDAEFTAPEQTEGDGDKDNLGAIANIGNVSNKGIEQLITQSRKEEAKQDVSGEEEGEIEGDEVLDKIGGETYKQRIDKTLAQLKEKSDEFLTPEALQTYSPKFLHMLENIQDDEHKGLHLIYSQFRTLEGIGIFSLVLEKNGFARFTIKKNESGAWKIDIPDTDLGKPTYALYTGTETSEEKEIIRHIYNGEWDLVPDTISSVLTSISNNNNTGEIIKVLMITSSGSEGINLRNTRYVHIMEPYWHPVRTEQVVGRARRICSHNSLPEELQTVEVFIYLMTFTDEQLKSDEAIELKKKDLSRKTPKVPITSDQNLFEISEIKANLNTQLVEAVKETSFDCYIYSNGKCINFSNPSNDKFSYVPDYAAQQSDTTVMINKTAVKWKAKSVTIMGKKYVSRKINPKMYYIYDKNSYEQATKDSSIMPLQIGTLEINDKGQEVFKQIVD